MAKKKGNQRVKTVSVNHYRKIALIVNPIVLLVLVALIIFKAPLEILVPIGVIGVGVWLYFLVKANQYDNKKYR